MATLTFLSSSDVHSCFYPQKTNNRNGPLMGGGFSKRVNVLNRIRMENGRCLLFDSGDFCAGTLFYEDFNGEADIEAMKFMRYDAVTIGNHDFEKGLGNLKHQLGRIPTDTGPKALCSNISRKDNGEMLFDSSCTFMHGDIRVGVFGIIGTDAYKCTDPAFQQETLLIDPLSTFIKVGAELRHQCDIVVCLSHSGDIEDEIFANEPVADLLLGGHTHKTYKDSAIIVPNGLSNGLGGTIWHQPPSLGFAFSLTKISVTKGSQEGSQEKDLSCISIELLKSSLEWVDALTEADDEVAKEWLHESYGVVIDAKINKFLGHCRVEWLEKDKEAMCAGRSPLGKFIASFVAHSAGKEIGIVNRGGIKAGFSQDEVITFGKAVEVVGNNSVIISLDIKGSLIRALVESSIVGGEFQCFGIEYDVEASSDILSSEIDTVSSKSHVKISISGITLEQISAGYRNVVDEVEDWQLEFASYIERMGELSESTLTHCKVNLSHDPSTFTV